MMPASIVTGVPVAFHFGRHLRCHQCCRAGGSSDPDITLLSREAEHQRFCVGAVYQRAVLGPPLTLIGIFVLSADAKRPDNIAMPFTKGLQVGAARVAVGRMIERGLLQGVEANISKSEPLRRRPAMAKAPRSG